MLIPHNIGSPVATVATAHVGATVPNFIVLEYHAREVPWWESLVAGDDRIQDGRITVPDGLGLGIELNWMSLSPTGKNNLTRILFVHPL